MSMTREHALRWMIPLTIATALAVVASAILTIFPPNGARTALAAPDPLACTGYPETRVFLEVQSWWTDPGWTEAAHVHAGTCFPLMQNMTGTSTFDVQVKLHKNPGTLFALSFDFLNGSDDDCTYNGVNKCYMNVPDVNCGQANDCTYWYSLTVNWSSVPAGWQELRIKPRVSFPPPLDTDPDVTFMTSSGWPVRVRSGTSGYRSACNDPTKVCEVQFRGWYEDFGYANVAVRQARDIVPQPTWSGASKALSWRIYNNAPDQPITRAECYVDPDFHNPSWVPNPFWTRTGTFPWTGTITVPLTGLANGAHRWACIAYSDAPNHTTPGTLAGVGVFNFTVAN